MTCIVGTVGQDGEVWIGGDSAGVAGLDLTVRADAKVFRRGEFLLGFTSSFRMGQLLRYKLEVPLGATEGDDLHEYMATVFVDAVRECLKANGYAQVSNNTESGGTFLVGYRGRLFKIESDFQVAEARSGYDACGCGEDFALGAMHVLQPLWFDPRVLLSRALKAAEEHSAGVRGPFLILSTP